MSDFTFPVLPDPTPLAPPLTAGSTVRDASASADGGEEARPRLVEVAQAVVPPDFQRQKIPLEKGFSQMDWMKLTATGKDLQGNRLNGLQKGQPRRREVSLEELAEHSTLDDGWVAVRGMVYNLSPYVRFHPGGAKILKAAVGKDATALFNKYHAWVNVNGLMSGCVVGPLQRPGKAERGDGGERGEAMLPGEAAVAADADAAPG